MGLVADDDPRFAALDPGLREMLNEAERMLKKEIAGALARALCDVPGIAREAVRPSFEALGASLPAAFISGQFQLYKTMSDLLQIRHLMDMSRKGAVN